MSREAKDRVPMRVLGWCVMPNHWHFVLWPRGDLSEFMRWLTVTHSQRWHTARRGRYAKGDITDIGDLSKDNE